MARGPWIALFLIALLSNSVSALYFFLEGGNSKCFIEELPINTIVVGRYKAEEWSDSVGGYIVNREHGGLQVVVEDLESQENIVRTRGLPEGKFTFTSHDAGDHSICVSTNYTGGWFGSQHKIKITLDIAVGEATVDQDSEREHVNDLASRVRDLNKRLEDIRSEQQFQREREVEFRKLSDSTNTKAVYWSLIQIFVLFATCYFQMRHLRGYFESKKIV